MKSLGRSRSRKENASLHKNASSRKDTIPFKNTSNNALKMPLESISGAFNVFLYVEDVLKRFTV